MNRKSVLSERLVKSRAAYLSLTMTELNDKAGFGPNYIYRLWGQDNMQLSTVNRIAAVLGVRACDILEEPDATQK